MEKCSSLSNSLSALPPPSKLLNVIHACDWLVCFLIFYPKLQEASMTQSKIVPSLMILVRGFC